MNLKVNKITCNSPEMKWTSPLNGLVTIRQKRTKTVKLKNSLIFLKQLTSK